LERQAVSLQSQLTQNLQKQQTYIDALAGCARGIGELQAEASRKLSVVSLKLTAKGLLEAPIVEQQRTIHLARFRIEPGLIAGFGAKRVTELAGHGIVTAADVSDHRIYRIPGFGASLTAEIVAWKASKEKSFRPTPIALPVHEVERRARELFADMKPEFLQKREALIKQMTRLTKDAEVCAGEAPVIQKKIDLLVANIRAVDAALKSLALQQNLWVNFGSGRSPSV
jgi:DNA-binding helix-hairpin-helix protein with protein kinase domain